MLEAINVTKKFGPTLVLKGVDMSLAEQEVGVLLGRSGSGKSTFLRCINHLERIDSGRISVDGQMIGLSEEKGRLHEISPKQVARQRRSIGMVFQQFNLFNHKTALDNIMHAPTLLGLKSRSEARINALELLDRVGLKERANAYPLQLSGGQQQRVAIARALAMEPRLMLFDEPTSSLDPELVGDVLGVMRDLATDGMTMLVVTHEIGFAREVADTAFFMHDGLIVESGPPELLLGSPQHQNTKDFMSMVL